MSIQTALQKARRINLSFLGVTVSESDFRTAAEKIFSRRVNVTRKTVPGSGIASVYKPDTRTLEIYTSDRSFPSNPWQEALIAHEGCHLAGHVKRRNLSGLHEEMLAHVVQAMYLLLHDSDSSGLTRQKTHNAAVSHLPSCPATDCEKARLGASLNIAMHLRQNTTPDPNTVRVLEESLKRDTSYTTILRRGPEYTRYPPP
jgi:hypothetical protein